jgi:hypothetical protein
VLKKICNDNNNNNNNNNNKSIQFNSLFIYVLSSTAGGQLQSQHGKQIQQTEQHTHTENKTRKK